MKERLIAAAIGFLLGDVIIGGLIWIIYSLSTGQWGTTTHIRTISGLIVGVIFFIMGERIIDPLINHIVKITEKRNKDKK